MSEQSKGYTEPPEWTNGDPPAAWAAGRTYQDKKPLPAFVHDPTVRDSTRRRVLLAIYAEVCSGWRCLTDVRFKLLGFVPLVSLAAIIAIVSPGKDGSARLGPIEVTALAIFGLLVTVGVRLYDRRNTQLYNDLIGRGRQIEGELGIHTGHFRGRPESHGLVQHDRAIALIYWVSIIGWFIAAVSPWSADVIRHLKSICP